MMRRFLAMTILCAACGSDEPKAPPPQKGGTAATQTPAAAAAKTQAMQFRAKVDQQYRKELTQSDFVPDSSGEINRDPFRSYLVQPAAIGGENTTPDQKDECENRMKAEKSGYGDLRLIGIITRGTRNFAMFKDSSQMGHIAFQGDCLSKDKARVLEITPGCVRIEVRAEAPPGAPAPPAREEKVCLHPEDIEIQ